MSVRVYVPATADLLRRWYDAGEVPADAERFVTGGPGDGAEDEQAEYGALMAAAEASAGLAGGDGRRVVVVGEATDEDAAVAWRRVASVHADPRPRPAGADPDEDLAWYAVQEVPDLLG